MRRPISPAAGRGRDDSERTTAVYLSIAVHVVVGLGLLVGHLTRPESPSFALHQDVDIVSIAEFDPLWRGRQLVREPLDAAPGAMPAPSFAAPAPSEPESDPGEPMHRVAEAAPPVPSSDRPEDRAADISAPARLAQSADPGRTLLDTPAEPDRTLVDAPADTGQWRLAETARAPSAPPFPAAPENAGDARAPNGSAVAAVRGSVLAAAISLDLDRARPIGAAPAIPGVGVPETDRRGPVVDAPGGALEGTAGAARGPVADGPAKAPEGLAASPVRPAAGKTPAPQVATVPNPAGETAMPNRAGEAAMPNPAGEAAPPNPAGEAAPPNPAGDVATPNQAGEAVAPHRRQAPAATLEGIVPAPAPPARAAEAGPGNRQPEAKGPAVAREGRTVPVLAAAAPRRRPARRAAAPAAAIELSLPAAGAHPSVRPSARETVPGTDVASIPVKIDAQRLLDGLLPFPRPGSARPGAAETAVAAIKRQGLAGQPPGADVREISRVLAAVACGRLAGDFDQATGTLRLQGHVASLAERARIYGELARLEGVGEIRDHGVVILPRPHCRVLDTLRQAGLTASTSHRASPQMLAGPTQAKIMRFDHGERIVIRLTTPAWPAYLYVDFYDLRGRVTHLIPNPRAPGHRFEAGHVLSIGEDGRGVALRAAAPYGANILVAIGTSAALFDRARPTREASEAYLAALHEAIAAKRRAGTALAEEYVYVFVITQDRPGGSARTDRRSTE